MNNQTQSNINAAKLNGHDPQLDNRGLVIVRASGKFHGREFNIFPKGETDMQAYKDLHDTEIKLGEEKGLSFICNGKEQWLCLNMNSDLSKPYKTKLEAITAAVEEVSK